MVEYEIFNLLVGGSNPLGPSKYIFIWLLYLNTYLNPNLPENLQNPSKEIAP